MNILLIGSLIPQDLYDQLVNNSKSKPSNAPENFQLSFSKGMEENQQKLDVLSFPVIASYPNGPCLYWKKSQYSLGTYTNIQCPGFANVPVLKQIGIFLSTYFGILRWFKGKNDEQNYIIVYSDYPPYAKAARAACRHGNAKCVLLMTDLATFSYYPHKKSLDTWARLCMEKICIADYRKYDGYILLSKYMESAMKIEDLPTTVVEGFSDVASFDFEETKTDRKVFMYAGSLSRVYNIDLLIDAFQKTSIDADLWIFGAGELEADIKIAAEKDKRIIFKGKVPRDYLLRSQKKANILLNIKSSQVEHTKYAFPSKLLEYMASGTAVLTTKVAGIPQEYFEYVMPIEDETLEGVTRKLEEVNRIPEIELQDLAEKAYRFVSEKKNCRVQAVKIIEFLSGL